MIGITLDDAEITRAIKNHISQMGLDISDKEIDVAFTAGRGANGNTATVTIKDQNTVATPTITPRKVAPTVKAEVAIDEPPEVEPEPEETPVVEEAPVTKESIFKRPSA